MGKITSHLKVHKTNAGKVTRRFMHTVEVDVFTPGEVSDATLDSIALWVSENKIGHRTAYNMWKLNNDEAVTLFLLKWNN